MSDVLSEFLVWYKTRLLSFDLMSYGSTIPGKKKAT